MKELIELAESKGYLSHFDWSGEDKGYEIYLGKEKFKKHVYIELCLIQKWLREEKNIVITIGFTEAECFYYVIYYGMKEYVSFDYEFNEQALKEGIKKALDLIK